MKKKFALALILLLSIAMVRPQAQNNSSLILPLKNQSSVMFGKDVVINNAPEQDQRSITVCSAFNGWLYGTYYFTDDHAKWINLRSVDNGITWEIILVSNSFALPTTIFPKIEMLCIGNEVSSMKVFLGYVRQDNLVVSQVQVIKFNAEPFSYEKYVYDGYDEEYDFSLATDYNFSSPDTNYTIGLLFPTTYGYDSIVFKTSTDQGNSFGNRQQFAGTNDRYTHVSLAYGRSPSESTGHYYAVWEEKTSTEAPFGKIFTAHTQSSLTGPFTTPVRMDNLDPSAASHCRNPVICCQASDQDNDSANITSVVMFEKYLPASNTSDLVGYYNLQSASTSHFRPLNIQGSTNDQQQPDIVFNADDSKFYLTYYDSTTQKLPLLSHDFNMTSPDDWTVVSPGYNDSTNLASPHPKVEIIHGIEQAINVWIAENPEGNGVALFDAPFSTYTGVSSFKSNNEATLYGSYPNPCKSSVTIDFEIKKAGNVNITLYDLSGRFMKTFTNQDYPSGFNQVKTDVSDLPSGSYIYSFTAGGLVTSGKINIIK